MPLFFLVLVPVLLAFSSSVPRNVQLLVLIHVLVLSSWSPPSYPFLILILTHFRFTISIHQREGSPVDFWRQHKFFPRTCRQLIFCKLITDHKQQQLQQYNKSTGRTPTSWIILHFWRRRQQYSMSKDSEILILNLNVLLLQIWGYKPGLVWFKLHSSLSCPVKLLRKEENSLQKIFQTFNVTQSLGLVSPYNFFKHYMVKNLKILMITL